MWSTRILVLIILFCTTCNERVVDEPDDLTASEKAIVSELDQLVFSIKGSSPTLTDVDLKPLDAIADARMVGLGEATHGTKEFFEMKHRIFRYLVTAHGFKAIGFESDFAESLIFEDYIQGRSNGDLHTLMDTKMGLWPWQALEVQALLEWMKLYNQNTADTDRIHFFGLDCQFVTFNADFLAERIALYDDNLAQYVRANSVDFKKLDKMETIQTTKQ